MIHRRRGLPDDWDALAAGQVSAWADFTPDEQERLAGIADWLLRHKDWEAAHGFSIDDAMRTSISLQAAVLVLDLDTSFYREVGSIVVYPTTIHSRELRAGPAAGTVTDEATDLLGEAQDRRGPILIAWDSVVESAQHPGRGHNVVSHEFAHKIDMLDGVVDGTPPLGTPAQLARWVEVCTAAYTALRDGRSRGPLDSYGGVSPAEFFAVATETFFDAPLALERDEADLFDVLRDFYRQDPADRARRAGARSVSDVERADDRGPG